MADALTHLDEQGRLKMVDVSGKEPMARRARVRGEIRMAGATARLIAENKVAKGSVPFRFDGDVKADTTIRARLARDVELSDADIWS